MKNYLTLFIFCLLAALPQHTFSQTPQWNYLGDTIIEETWASGILTSLEGNVPYVAYQVFDTSNFFWKIKRFDGFAWVEVDTNGLGYQNFRFLGTTANGVLQIAYHSYDSHKFGIKRLIGSTWETVSESPGLVTDSYPATYAFDDEKFFVAFPEPGLDNKITVWKYDAGAWSVVGQPGFSSGNVHSITLKISDGIPWVAYEDWSLGRAGVVQKFDGSTWQNVGGQVYDGDLYGKKDFTVSNDIPYIAHADSSTQNRASVLKFDGANWSNVGPPMFTERTDFLKLAINADNQEPYLLFEDSDPSFWGLSSLHFNGTAWDYVGTRGFISNFWSLEFVIHNGVPTVGYERSPFGGGASVQVFRPLSHSTMPQAEVIAFQLQPNPITDGLLQIQIGASITEGAICQIFDQNGRLILEKMLPADSGEAHHNFNVSGFPPGVYTLRLQLKNGKKWATKRFVVAR
jgi:hypothetical protein